MKYHLLLATLVGGMLCPSLVHAQYPQGSTGAVSRVASSGKALPNFKQVEAVVRRHFAAIKGYQPGDIISEADVTPLIKQLNLLGWRSAGFRSIVSKVPRDDSFLVRTLRTDRGRKFMRQVATFPMAYDRLDRMTAIPSGRKLLKDLIRSKGGYQMIQYMTTSQGGKNLGRQLSNVPNGADFNQPTGQIYTELQLVEALHDLFESSSAGASRP